MSILQTKLVVSLFFIAAGTIAVLTMLYVMGRPEKKLSPGVLRTTHRVVGVIFVILLIVLAYIGARFTSAMGDGMPLRAVFHAVFAVSLVAVLLMKILIVKFYRELMRFVPTMGLIVFALAFVVFFTSAGYHFVRDLASEPAAMSEEVEEPDSGRGSDPAGAVVAGGEVAAEAKGDGRSAGDSKTAEAKGDGKTAAGSKSKPSGDIKAGRAIFNNKCVGCHNTDSRKSLFGPGLLGLMKSETLRSSGAPPSPENVRGQIIDPVSTMPAFTTFSNKEMGNLLAYLGTL
jgi:mono/diheme cytochrome c family protein